MSTSTTPAATPAAAPTTSSSSPLDQQLVEALRTLYFSDDRTQKQAASRWLEDFQKMPDAWLLADRLLNATSADNSLELQVFGAQTIRNKITYDLKQLDATAQSSLRDALLTLLTSERVARGPRSITTQLCLSLAGLALQMEAWQGAFRTMVDLWRQQRGITDAVLLEFLTVLPEECHTDHIRVMHTIDQPEQSAFITKRTAELLTDNAAELLQLAMEFLQKSPTSAENVFRCLHSWLKSNDISVQHLANHPIVGLTFQALRSEDLFEVACDLLCQLIKEAGNVEEGGSGAALAAEIMAGLEAAQDLVAAACSEDEDDDEDRQRGLCRLYAEAGEIFLPLAASPDPSLAHKFHAVTQLVLKCTSFRDLDAVPITFNFWFELTRILLSERAAAVKAGYVPVYGALVDVMIRHLRFPADDAEVTAEERDEFREFRHVMGDVLKDCCIMLGEVEALSKPYQLLTTYLSAQPITASWQEIEAPLFSLRSLGAEVSDTESTVMPHIMGLLRNLPEHPKIRYAATLVIGRYAGWTRVHPEFIEPHLSYISGGFQHTDVSAAAALALKYLCQSCGELMVDYLSTLHPFYINALTTLPQYDALELTEAVVHIMNKLPAEQLLPVLQSFCLPIAQKLHELASRPVGATERSTVVKELDATLERLNVFLRHIQPKIAPSDSTSTHPCVGLLQEMWPILTQIMQHYGDTLVSEVLCKCFKNAIISYDHHFLPLLLPFIEQATSTFVSTRQPCYPWAASHAIKRFAKTGGSEVIAAFVSMYQTMLQVTLQTLDSPERFDTFPDLVEDMFHLSSTFLRAVPDVFLALPPPVLAALLNMSKMGTECRHNDCIERALFWLRDLFQLKYATEPTLTSASIEQLTKLAQEFGPVLIMSILQGVTGTGASGLPFSGALYPAAAAALFYWTHAVGFDVALALVGAALGALSEERVSATDKAQIMELYQSSLETKKVEKLRYALTNLSSAYRGASRNSGPPRRKLEF